MMTMERLARGKKGEAEAAQELTKLGHRILQHNYRCKIGEIDLIAEKAGGLVFVEVKTRTSARFGLPQENVGYRKQEKIRRVAQMYLAENRQFSREVSFCVVAVFLDKADRVAKIEVFEEAF